jgi:ubiquinol oxidase
VGLLPRLLRPLSGQRPTAHRVVGYFEEEAVISYTHYLAEIDEGRSARTCRRPRSRSATGACPKDATLRDVVLVVRADEAHHRDVNHGFANELAGLPVDEALIAPCPPHESGIRLAA